MKRLVLIDGNAILHRAFHALPPLTTSSGELVNAVFGFMSMLLRVFEELKPEYVAVCFDRKAPTFRKKKFKEYQAQRPAMDQDLSGQIERVKQVVTTMNIPIFEMDGYEADDIIGTLAKQVSDNQKTRKTQRTGKSENQKTGESEEIETIIVTGDRDIMQLVDERTKVFAPAKGGLSDAKLYDAKAVEEKLGVKPEQIPDYKGLVGDSSDNYPGVNGIGPKTAIELITKYRRLKDIYKNLDEISPKVAEKLKNDKKNADLSYFLATIARDAPVKLDLSRCKLTDYDWEKVAELFDELEFRSLITRLPKDIHDFKVKAGKKGAEQTKLFE